MFIYTYKVKCPIILDGVTYKVGDIITTTKDLSNHIFFHLGYIILENKKEINKKASKKANQKGSLKKNKI